MSFLSPDLVGKNITKFIGIILILTIQELILTIDIWKCESLYVHLYAIFIVLLCINYEQ